MVYPSGQLLWNFAAFLVIMVLLILYLTTSRNKTGGGSLRHVGNGKLHYLRLYARDLTEQAARGELDPVIGREAEIARVILILSRRKKNNPVLVGPAGVGKTAIVEGLAQAIVDNKVPESLRGKKVVALDLSGLVAGTKYRGEFEERLTRVANEIIQNKRQIILFIDEIHTLAEAGDAAGAIDADDILKPALARGELQVVGATTPEEYKKNIRPDKTLDRRLQPLLIAEPSSADTITILKGLRATYEQHHDVEITDDAIRASVRLAQKNMKDRFFPDKALDLLDEASANVHLQMVQKKSARRNRRVVGTDISEVMSLFQRQIF